MFQFLVGDFMVTPTFKVVKFGGGRHFILV